MHWSHSAAANNTVKCISCLPTNSFYCQFLQFEANANYVCGCGRHGLWVDVCASCSWWLVCSSSDCSFGHTINYETTHRRHRHRDQKHVTHMHTRQRQREKERTKNQSAIRCHRNSIYFVNIYCTLNITFSTRMIDVY